MIPFFPGFLPIRCILYRMSSPQSKIHFVDAFPAFNEVELCLFRIRYLRNVVNHFVIAESSISHSGKPKELVFQNWFREREHEFPDVTIIHVNLEGLTDSWSREIYTREYLQDYIYSAYLKSNFIISDLDEIPSRSQVEAMAGREEYVHFSTPTYYRKLNLRLTDGHSAWSRGVMGHTSLVQLPNGGRFTKLPLLTGVDHGAHFSYLVRDNKGFDAKLEGFAHVELNQPVLKTKAFLKFVDDFQVDHLGRLNEIGNGLLEFIPKEKLNDLQRRLFEMFPDFAVESKTQFSRKQRLLASFIVTMIVNQPKKAQDLSNFFISKQFSLYFLAKIFPCLLSGMLSFLTSISKRKVKLLKSQYISVQ